MQKIIEVLKNRRTWAAICALVAVGLRAFGADTDFDANKATDAIMALVQAVADVGAVILPIWSLYKPKASK